MHFSVWLLSFGSIDDRWLLACCCFFFCSPTQVNFKDCLCIFWSLFFFFFFTSIVNDVYFLPYFDLRIVRLLLYYISAEIIRLMLHLDFCVYLSVCVFCFFFLLLLCADIPRKTQRKIKPRVDWRAQCAVRTLQFRRNAFFSTTNVYKTEYCFFVYCHSHSQNN